MAPQHMSLWIARGLIGFAALLELFAFFVFFAVGLWSEESLNGALRILAVVTLLAGGIMYFGIRLHRSIRPPRALQRPGWLWVSRGLILLAVPIELFGMYIFMISGQAAVLVLTTILAGAIVFASNRAGRRATGPE